MALKPKQLNPIYENFKISAGIYDSHSCDCWRHALLVAISGQGILVVAGPDWRDLASLLLLLFQKELAQARPDLSGPVEFWH